MSTAKDALDLKGTVGFLYLREENSEKAYFSFPLQVVSDGVVKDD
jgi:hypothetical protein